MFRNRTLINVAAIYGGEALCRLTTFVVAFIVARRFSEDALGQYGYAVALASIFVLLPDLGLHLLVTRDVAANPQSLSRAFWDLHELKFVLAGLATAGLLAFGTLALHDLGRRRLLYILAIRALLQTFSLGCMSFFKAMERMHYVAFQQLANGLITVSGLLVCLYFGAGLYTTVSALLLGQMVEVLLGWWFMYRHFNPGRLREWNGGRLVAMLVTAIPIGITTVLQAFGIRLDVLILGLFVSNAELGQFQAAALLIVASFLAASLLMTVLFPKLVRLQHHKNSEGPAYLDSLLKNGFLLATCLSVVVWCVAPLFIQEFFGRPLSDAIRFLRTLAPALPFVFINTSMFYVFLAANRRREYLMTLVFSIGLGALLSFLLAPQLGGTGVALADLAREVSASFIYVFLLNRTAPERAIGSTLLKIIPGTTGLACVTFFATGGGSTAQVWAVIWSLAMLLCTVLLSGTPGKDQIILLAREDL